MQECLVQMGLVEEDTLRSYARVEERFLGDVSKFLNRILGLPVAKQNLVSTHCNLVLSVCSRECWLQTFHLTESTHCKVPSAGNVGFKGSISQKGK